MAFKRGEGGRPRGARNKSTRELRDVLDQLAWQDASGKPAKTDVHAARLHQLTLSSDEHVAVKALGLAFAYRFGKPPETIELAGVEDRPVLVKFVDA